MSENAEDHSVSGSGSSATTTPTKDGSSILSGSVDPFLQGTPLTPPKPGQHFFPSASFTPFDPLGSGLPRSFDQNYYRQEQDLDLSSVLGNLNLDYELDSAPLSYQRAGSLTPGASVFAPKTPTWSTGPQMPSSAPPARSFDTSSLGALGVRPFQLPEDVVPASVAPADDSTLQPSLLTPLKDRRATHPQPMDEMLPRALVESKVWNNRLESYDNRRWNGNNGPMAANPHRKPAQRRRGEDAARFVNAKLEDFVGEIYTLCKDQHGCRFLQRQLDIQGEYAAVLVFSEISEHVVDLMVDPFGNYLVQKLLEKLPQDYRLRFVQNAAPQFARVALDPHGTRALQKLVECISTDQEAAILRESLTPHVVVLSRDLNGNHVVQKCLQMLRPDQFQFIFDSAYENCTTVATHRHGCCVLQRCLDHGSREQCERLSLEVSRNCVPLSLDPFGNYVVQYVIGRECNGMHSADQFVQNGAMAAILESIKMAIFKLSLHKFGSNVIEKCLRIPLLSRVLIDHILENPVEVQVLLHDAYGNYVLQTSLDVADTDRFDRLSGVIRPLLPSVRSTPHGRRISGRIQQRQGAHHRHSSSVAS